MRPLKANGIRRNRTKAIACATRFIAVVSWALGGFVAASTNAADEIPPLRPPIRQIPADTWERYGVWIILAASLLVLCGAVLAVWLMRPKPAVVVPPARRARSALASLQQKPHDQQYLISVCRILREYLISTFDLPRGEMTTAEFEQALLACESADLQMATAAIQFLRNCDHQKFAPSGANPSWNSAAEALQIVDTIETGRSGMPAQPA